MLGQRRGRWTKIGPTLGGCLVFAAVARKTRDVFCLENCNHPTRLLGETCFSVMFFVLRSFSAGPTLDVRI